MKLLVLVEVDVSPTLAETMQRNGFTLAPDGSQMQVKIPNSPPVPQRKTHVAFVESPPKPLQQLVEDYKKEDGHAAASPA